MKELIKTCQLAAFKIYIAFDGSHDVAHIQRVMKNAEMIIATEPTADSEIIKLAVLLHDIDDPKYKKKHQLSARKILEESGAPAKVREQVLACIETVSFSGGNSKMLSSIEGAIVRDADRLDAIGAIGIARAFTYGGTKNSKLYETSEVVREKMSEEAYRTQETSIVTHFHEKLLLLKDLMVTDEGRRLAEKRHQYMIRFLEQLKSETGEPLI